MKTSKIVIEIKGEVNGKSVPCELAPGSKILVNGDIVINSDSIEIKDNS